MGDFLLEEQHRVLKLGHVLKTLALPYSAKHLLTDEDTQQFKKVLYEALEVVNKLRKYLLLEECQIDEENIFKTIQLFLEQQRKNLSTYFRLYFLFHTLSSDIRKY